MGAKRCLIKKNIFTFRSLSPKTSRKSLKLVKGRSSPYSTRSDSSSHMLRNGKHRKLTNLNLLDGLDGYKRRKRVHSDLSGSETASKLSGYESDSSFSDLASLHGSEKDSDLSKAVCLFFSKHVTKTVTRLIFRVPKT